MNNQNIFFDKIAGLMPDNDTKIILLTQRYYYKGEYDSVIIESRKMQNKTPETEFLAACSSMFLNRFDGAKILFENIILNFGDSKYSADALVFYKMLNSDMPPSEMENFGYYFSLQPNSSHVDFEILKKIKNQPLREMALLMALRKNIDQAYEMNIEEVIKEPFFLSEALYLKAEKLINQKKQKEAKPILERIILEFNDSLLSTISKKILKNI